MSNTTLDSNRVVSHSARGDNTRVESIATRDDLFLGILQGKIRGTVGYNKGLKEETGAIGSR